MEGADTIWLVTSGCYSDYSVLAAFSSEGAAISWAKGLGRFDPTGKDDYGARVEGIPLNPTNPLDIQFKLDRGLRLWQVWHHADPKPSYYQAWSAEMVDVDRGEEEVRKNEFGMAPSYTTTFWAASKEEALKAGMERIMQAIALERV